MNLPKRNHHYLLPPSKFEIDGCSCGNNQTQWSEYEKHLWCDKCNIDFIPNHNGILDGPIALQTAALFGIVFHRKNLISNKYEILNSNALYIEVLDLNLEKDVSNIAIKINDINYYGSLIFNPKEFSFKFYNLPDGDYKLEIATYKNIFKLWDLSIHSKNNLISIKPSKDYDILSKIILNCQLDNSLVNHHLKNNNKI